MALKPVVFPAVYERQSPVRTEDEIMRGLNERFDSPASPPLLVTTAPAAPPPPDRDMPATMTIGHIRPERKKATGRPAVKRVAAEKCREHKWYRIGKSRTAGKARRRCRVCRVEETILESEVVVRRART